MLGEKVGLSEHDFCLERKTPQLISCTKPLIWPFLMNSAMRWEYKRFSLFTPKIGGFHLTCYACAGQTENRAHGNRSTLDLELDENNPPNETLGKHSTTCVFALAIRVSHQTFRSSKDQTTILVLE